jgi:hypothetical protein
VKIQTVNPASCNINNNCANSGWPVALDTIEEPHSDNIERALEGTASCSADEERFAGQAYLKSDEGGSKSKVKLLGSCDKIADRLGRLVRKEGRNEETWTCFGKLNIKLRDLRLS